MLFFVERKYDAAATIKTKHRILIPALVRLIEQVVELRP
jgi:hypothetical protein